MILWAAWSANDSGLGQGLDALVPNMRHAVLEDERDIPWVLTPFQVSSSIRLCYWGPAENDL
jgi:hypothetical protein